MKSFIISLILFFLLTKGYSQDITRNTIFFETGGASFFYSINYERLSENNTENNFAFRAGFMYLNFFNRERRNIVGFPFGLSYMKKIKRNFIETGVTISFITDQYVTLGDDGIYGSFNRIANPGSPWVAMVLDDRPDEGSYVSQFVLIPALRIGLRHQPIVKGFFWNGALQVMGMFSGDFNDLLPPFESYILPYAGFGAGYAF